MAPPIHSFAPDTSLALIKAQQSSTHGLDPKALKKADDTAVDFEAVMLSEMLKPMFETIEVDDTFGGGKGEEVFRGMAIQEYGKIIAHSGGIGIADVVKKQLIELQGGKMDALAQNDVIDVTGAEIDERAAAE